MWKFGGNFSLFFALACTLSVFGAIDAWSVARQPAEQNLIFPQSAFADTVIAANQPLPPDTASASAPQKEAISSAAVPTMPQAAVPTRPATAGALAGKEDPRPAHLNIPSIGLDTAVVNVGQNGKGEMAVPAGTTNNVGWYEFGTIPGGIGNAVFDAHVFAAFSKLRYVKVGDDIFVTTRDGRKRHFIVTDSRVYALSELSGDTLFGDHGIAALNLITCAGHLTPDHSTYDHRLVVFTKFVGEEQ